jgi:hypothetical protein
MSVSKYNLLKNVDEACELLLAHHVGQSWHRIVHEADETRLQ